MALLDLKTNLKSLKYGSDTPGGGNSGQPYQQVDINTADSGFNRFRMTKFDDGLVRGGVVGAANASIVDTFRIGKFLKDFPKGPLFIVKQIGLQLSNPRLESKKLNTSSPTSGQGFLSNVGNLIANTANKIVNAVGPTRIYNLGINTLAQIPVNAFGQHFNRHGLLPVQDDQTKYLAVAQFNNEGGGSPNNRLVGLKTRFRLGDMKSSTNPQFFTNAQRRAAGQVTSGLFLQAGIITKPKPVGFLNANGELAIDRYVGGAQSVYGIGNTTILRRAFTEDATKIDVAFNQSKIWAGKSHLEQGPTEVKISSSFDFGISNKTNSSLSSKKFDLLNDKLNNSFLNFTASVNDYHGTNKDQQQRGYNDANKKIKTSLGFVGVSTKTSSSFIPNKLPDLTDFGSLDDYKRNTLDDQNWSQYKNNSSYKGSSVIVRNDIKLSSKTTSSLSLIKTGTFSSGQPYKQKDFNRFRLLPLGSGSLPINGNPVTYNGGKPEGSLITSADLGLSKQYFNVPASEIDIPRPDNTTYSKIATRPISLTVNAKNEISPTSEVIVPLTPISNRSYQAYQKIIESRQLRERTYTVDSAIGAETVNAFGIYGNNTSVKDTLGNIIPDSSGSPIYSNGKKIIQINKSWREVSREIRVGSGQQDQINLTPLFENTTGTMGDDVTIGGKKYNINDLVKFRIQALNSNNPGLGKWMIFRAYLTQFSDTVNAQWGEIQYAGRGDKFYVYTGFNRSVNIGFKVAALSAEEMQPMYQKLNYLMGNLMGEYYDNVMRGTLVKMTVGNWFDGQDGILNSLSYTVPQESPWEIGLRVNNGIEPLVLPHVIDVQMTFTPIGSQTKGVNKISEKNSETSHFAQNYNKETQYATKFSKVG